MMQRDAVLFLGKLSKCICHPDADTAFCRSYARKISVCKNKCLYFFNLNSKPVAFCVEWIVFIVDYAVPYVFRSVPKVKAGIELLKACKNLELNNLNKNYLCGFRLTTAHYRWITRGRPCSQAAAWCQSCETSVTPIRSLSTWLCCLQN
jgi:hypothetical protein